MKNFLTLNLKINADTSGVNTKYIPVIIAVFETEEWIRPTVCKI